MNGFSSITAAMNVACQRYSGFFHEEEHPRQQAGLFAPKGQGTDPVAPGIEGAQQGLFGNEDLRTGQRQLFNTASEKKPKRRMDQNSIKSITAGLDAKLKAILESKPTVSPADRGIVVQAPSLPGQKEMFAREITAEIDRYSLRDGNISVKDLGKLFAGMGKAGEVLVDQVWDRVQKGQNSQITAGAPGIFEQAVNLAAKHGLIRSRDDVRHLADNTGDRQSAAKAMNALHAKHGGATKSTGGASAEKTSALSTTGGQSKAPENSVSETSGANPTGGGSGSGWDESKHPRQKSGQPTGGQFAPKSGGQSGTGGKGDGDSIQAARPGSGIDRGPDAGDLKPHGVKAQIDDKSGTVKVHGLTAALDHWWKENGLGGAAPTAQDVADRGLKAVRGENPNTVKLKGLTDAINKYLEERSPAAPEPTAEASPGDSHSGKKFQSEIPADSVRAADLKVGDTILWPHTFGPPIGTPLQISGIEEQPGPSGNSRNLTLTDGKNTFANKMRPDHSHFRVKPQHETMPEEPRSGENDNPPGSKREDGILVNNDGQPIDEQGKPLTGEALRDQQNQEAETPVAPDNPQKAQEASESSQPMRTTADGRRIGAAQMHFSDLKRDPTRFQYKSVGVGDDGVTDELKDVKEFNPMLGGQLLVWHDPGDGQTYVVNGHHRHELAERSGEHQNWDGKMSVYYVDATSAKTARAHGALTNIAEGRGSAIDAAKFLRDSQLTQQEMESQHGISLKGKVAKDSLALTNLSDKLFQQLTQEEIGEGRALAIAHHLPDHAKQDVLLRQIKKSEDKSGKFLPDSTVSEMARELHVTPTKKKSDSGSGPGLFGDDDWDEPLIAERAHLKAFLRRSLTGERNTFKAASTARRQSTLQSTGENKIDIGANKAAAKTADVGLWDFDKRVNAAGDSLAQVVSDAAAKWSEAKGERERRGVEKSLLETVNELLRADSGGKAGSAGERQGAD